MGKYTITDIVDRDGIVQYITPSCNKIPVIYIDLLDGKFSKVATLKLNKKEEALVEKYSRNIPGLGGIDTGRLIEFSNGKLGIDDLTTPELFELSELPPKAVKRKGYVKEAIVRTFAKDIKSNEIYTTVHYSVVDEHGAEVTPIIIDGILIVPELVATAHSFLEATGHHGKYTTGIRRQLKSFEEEYERVRRASSK